MFVFMKMGLIQGSERGMWPWCPGQSWKLPLHVPHLTFLKAPILVSYRELFFANSTLDMGFVMATEEITFVTSVLEGHVNLTWPISFNSGNMVTGKAIHGLLYIAVFLTRNGVSKVASSSSSLSVEVFTGHNCSRPHIVNVVKYP